MQHLTEATILDDSDTLISVWHLDLRNPQDRTPIRTLVKACRKAHAISELGTIRISKPERFRKYGEGLIRDPAETRVSRTIITSETIDDTDKLLAARQIDDELGRCADAVGSTSRLTTKSIKTTHSEGQTLTSGKNLWIYSTSIESVDEEQTGKWKASLPEEYDHIDRIHGPREFARALGSLVVEQLGPLCNDQSVRHSINGRETSHSQHKSQLIIHGPVVYAADPFKLVTNAHSSMGKMCLPIFVKNIRYAAQREYRFLIWSEEELTEDYIDLTASKALFGSLEERTSLSPAQVTTTATEPAARASQPDAIECTEESDEGAVETEAWRSRPAWPSMEPTNTRTIPSTDPDFLAGAVEEAAAAESALAALRQRVGDVEGERRTNAASAAWHAEPYIRKLCATFVDPIASVSMTEDDLLVVALNIPGDADSRASISFGPLGAHAYRISTKNQQIGSFGRPSPSLHVPNSFLEKLAEIGLPPRKREPE